LHTWSLAVEEQFYLLWPLTILFIDRLGRQSLLLLLAILSLAFAHYQALEWPEAGFYLLPSRVCEFAAGAALAAFGTGFLKSQTLREGLAAGWKDVITRLEAMGKQVVIVSQVPECGFDPGRCLTRALWFAREPACQQSRTDAMRRLAASLTILRQVVAARPGLRLIETQDVFCSATTCASNSGKMTPWYHDFDHLTADGAKHLSALVAERLVDMPRK